MPLPHYTSSNSEERIVIKRKLERKLKILTILFEIKKES